MTALSKLMLVALATGVVASNSTTNETTSTAAASSSSNATSTAASSSNSSSTASTSTAASSSSSNSSSSSSSATTTTAAASSSSTATTTTAAASSSSSSASSTSAAASSNSTSSESKAFGISMQRPIAITLPSSFGNVTVLGAWADSTTAEKKLMSDPLRTSEAAVLAGSSNAALKQATAEWISQVDLKAGRRMLAAEASATKRMLAAENVKMTYTVTVPAWAGSTSAEVQTAAATAVNAAKTSFGTEFTASFDKLLAGHSNSKYTAHAGKTSEITTTVSAATVAAGTADSTVVDNLGSSAPSTSDSNTSGASVTHGALGLLSAFAALFVSSMW